MYTLTTAQPTASALFGPKTIIIQGRRDLRAAIGKPIAICAGAEGCPLNLNRAVSLGWDRQHLLEYWPHLFQHRTLPRNVVLGTALVRQGQQLSARHSKAALADCSRGNFFGLVLTHRRLFPEPIPLRSKTGLGFWTEPDFVRREGYFPEID